MEAEKINNETYMTITVCFAIVLILFNFKSCYNENERIEAEKMKDMIKQGCSISKPVGGGPESYVCNGKVSQ